MLSYTVHKVAHVVALVDMHGLVRGVTATDFSEAGHLKTEELLFKTRYLTLRPTVTKKKEKKKKSDAFS